MKKENLRSTHEKTYLFSFKSVKDIIKLIRSIIELIILGVILFIIIRAWVSFSVYEAYQESTVSDIDYGFVVVSYFGVERSGNLEMIGVDRLEAHLKALHSSGYVTVSQQDIIDYYENKKNLPEKALLLIFEDGNRESLIFAQKIMEKYNYKATILNFADGFVKNDPKLLNSNDIKRIKKSTFWEIGTNGYRMEYINVFDKDGNYLGEMDPLTLNSLKKDGLVGNDYDHYLMDYLRDKKRLPKESYDDMERRISGDYIKIYEVYERELGYIPMLYAIVNPNTGAFGHNKKVSAINEKCMYDLFKINLNRLGYSSNNRESSIYDLTRTQPQPYWYANHLLMRLFNDTGQKMSFVQGDANRAAYWDEINGKAEFNSESIILTSLPDGEGCLRLKNSGEYRNIDLQVQLEGNKYGTQSILLRMDENFENGIAVSIKNNVLYINEIKNKNENTLFVLDLNILDGFDDESNISNISEPGLRLVELSLFDEWFSVYIDKKEAAVNIPVTIQNAGFVGIKSETSIRMANQRTPVDNIYDGVFNKLVITENNGEVVLFDSRLSFTESIKNEFIKIWKSITDWFIENM